MKGIILAGGAGTRLHPVTIGVSKQILPVYDKPMIYYPLSVLMLANIRDILIITTPEDQASFIRTLGDGSDFGINIEYRVQPKPEGLAQAFIIGDTFIGSDNCALVLGDNIFYGTAFSGVLKNAVEKVEKDGGSTVFAYSVKDPQRFGVVEFDENKKALNIEEKPENPKSNYAVTGLYFYDNKVVEYVKDLKPSKRGELEITDLNNKYIKANNLNVEILHRGFAWLDTGTQDSLLRASLYIKAIEDNQGIKIACLEEVAYRMGYIDKKQLHSIANKYPNNPYYQYIGAIKE